MLAILAQAGVASLSSVISIVAHKREIKRLMKREVREGLHEKDLVRFTERQLLAAEWEHAREFFLGSEKFDVVRKENSSQGIIFVCINDKMEVSLMKQLDKNTESKSLLDDVIKKIQFSEEPLQLHFKKTQFIRKNYPFPVDHYCFDPCLTNLKPPMRFV